MSGRLGGANLTLRIFNTEYYLPGIINNGFSRPEMDKDNQSSEPTRRHDSSG
jgi:hypothetical protein